MKRQPQVERDLQLPREKVLPRNSHVTSLCAGSARCLHANARPESVRGNNDNGTNVARATKANFSARLAGLANKPARPK